MSNKYVEQFLTAMEIISQAQIDATSKDNTIEAIVSSIESDGSYKVTYQDESFTAYSDAKYEIGDIVFVLRPGSSTEIKDSVIVAKKQTASSLISEIVEEDISYIELGNNIINKKPDQSYSFDSALLKGLIQRVGAIKIGAKFKTELNKAFFTGDIDLLNYGVKIEAKFKTESGTEIRKWILDINDMIGVPYYYSDFTLQEKVVSIEDPENFIEITSCEFFSNLEEEKGTILCSDISLFAVIEGNKITNDELWLINCSNDNVLENNDDEIEIQAVLVSKDQEKTSAYSWEVKSEGSEEWISLSDQISQTIDLSPTTVWAKSYQIRGVITLTDEGAIYSEPIDIVNALGLTVNVSREENMLVIDSQDQYTGVVAYLWQVKDVHGQIMPDKEHKFRTYPIDPTTIEISNEYIGSVFVNDVYIGSDSEFVAQVIPPEPAIPPAKIYSLSLSNDSETVAITSSGKPLAGANNVIAATVASVWVDNDQVENANITLTAPDSFYNGEGDNKVLNSKLIAFNNGKLQLYGFPTESVDSYTFIFKYQISKGNVLQEDFIVKKFASEEDYSLQIATPVVNLTTNSTGTIMFYVTRRDTNGLNKLSYEKSKGFISVTDANNTPIEPSAGSSAIEHKISYDKNTVFPLTITLTVNNVVWDEEEIEAVENGSDAVAYTMELTNEKDILLVEKSTGLARDGELDEAATGIQILKNEKSVFNSKNLSISNETDFVFDSTSNKVKLNKTGDTIFTDAQQFSTEINYKVNDNLTLTKTFTVTIESDFEHEYFLVLPISVNVSVSAPSISWKICKDNSNTVATSSDNCTLEIFEGDSTTASSTVIDKTSDSYTLKTDVSKVRFRLSTGSGNSKYIWDEEEVSIIKNGDKGDSSLDFNVTSSAPAFIKNKDGEIKEPIILTAKVSNIDLTGKTIRWQKKDEKNEYVNISNATGFTYKLEADSNNVGNYRAYIDANNNSAYDNGEWYDTIDIGLLEDGSDAFSVVLTNPTMTFNSSSETASESCDINVYKGATLLGFNSGSGYYYKIKENDIYRSSKTFTKAANGTPITADGSQSFTVEIHQGNSLLSETPVTIYWNVVENGKTPVKNKDYFDGSPGNSITDEIITAYWTQASSAISIPPSTLPSKPDNTETPTQTDLNGWVLTLGTLSPGNLHTYKTTSVRKKTVIGANLSTSYSWTDWSAPELYAIGNTTDAGLIAQVNTFMGITNNGQDQGVYYARETKDEQGNIVWEKVTNLSEFDPSLDKVYINAEYIEAKSIGADKIASKSIGAEQIAANSIGAEQIKANSITTNEIDADNLTVNKLLVKNGDNTLIDAGASNAKKVTIGGFTVTGASMQSGADENRVYLGTDQIQLGKKFTVTNEGVVVALEGSFTGTVNVGSDTENNDGVGLVGNSDGLVAESLMNPPVRRPIRIYAGAKTANNVYPFMVLSDGSVYATAAKLDGEHVILSDTIIFGSSGTIGSFTGEVNNTKAALTKAQQDLLQAQNEITNLKAQNEKLQNQLEFLNNKLQTGDGTAIAAFVDNEEYVHLNPGYGVGKGGHGVQVELDLNYLKTGAIVGDNWNRRYFTVYENVGSTSMQRPMSLDSPILFEVGDFEDAGFPNNWIYSFGFVDIEIDSRSEALSTSFRITGGGEFGRPLQIVEKEDAFGVYYTHHFHSRLVEKAPIGRFELVFRTDPQIIGIRFWLIDDQP